MVKSMTAHIISGKEISAKMKDELKVKIDSFRESTGVAPTLAVILVGDDPASHSYVKGKEKACALVGIEEKTHLLAADTPERELLSLVQNLNDDEDVHGILVQLPLPPQIDEKKVIDAISLNKDVDGFHPQNVGKLVSGDTANAPCTPLGILELLNRGGYPPRGKHVVIVGRSMLVGKPLANLLIQKSDRGDATVTICHSRTEDLSLFTKMADILVVAVGRPNTVNGDMVKEGAVVIDVGVNRVDDPTAKRGYRLVGDVDYDSVSQKAVAITPVPGGVGPMTITMLLHNTFDAARRLVEGSN